MKKLLTLLLALSFVFAMTACGGSTATDEAYAEEVEAIE